MGAVILVIVFVFAGWQIYHMGSSKSASVLSLSTTKTLEERVSSLEARVYTLEKKTGVVSAGTKKTTESFIAVAGGDFSSNDWSKITGTDFTLDTSLYGSNVEVSWQGWLNGESGSIRLYDATNHRVVDFSEVKYVGDGKKSYFDENMKLIKQEPIA
jgi:hypothetical protein